MKEYCPKLDNEAEVGEHIERCGEDRWNNMTTE